MRVNISTAIVGGIDKPKCIPFQVMEQGNSLSLSFYNEDYVPDWYLKYPHRTQALYFKTNLHELHSLSDYCIWIDSKVQIDSVDFVQQCLNAIGDGDIAILKHGERTCVYEEIDYIESQIIQGNRYLAARYAHRPIRQQVEYYRAAGYPKNNGLNDCSIFIFKNNKTMDNIMHHWWHDCLKGNFDQISIQYICWLMETKIRSIDFRNETFHLVKHLKVC